MMKKQTEQNELENVILVTFKLYEKSGNKVFICQKDSDFISCINAIKF